MMPEFPEGTITSMEPISAEQLKKEGWGPGGTRDNWGDGPWRDEPDRVEWIEPETGYRCEIRRNRAGSLCGYVTVPEDHIWHGIEYSGCVNRHPQTEEKDWGYKVYPCLDYDKEDRCSSPESMLRVHGGLTYSGKVDDGGWRYGFDTAHCGDYSPGMEATMRQLHVTSPNPYSDPDATFDPITGIKHEHGLDEVYRDMSYVKSETESLAKQLWAIHKVGI